MVSTEEDNVKCLMIGAKGIGKTTFLSQFPNSKLLNSTPPSHTEAYRINCLNEIKIKKSKSKTALDHIDIDIDTYDIKSDTMFINQTELVESNERLINLFKYKVIILCFALNDPNSYDLLQNLWHFYLRKYFNCNKHFILLGLKSDTINSFESLSKASLLASIPERSSSVSSHSSTSKLHVKKIRNNSFGDPEAPNIQFMFKCDYRRFARKITGGLSIIEVESIEHSSDLVNATRNSIESYTRIARYICHYSLIKPKELNKSKYKIPRVLSVPINYLISHRSRRDNPQLAKEPQSIVYEKQPNQQEDKLTMNTTQTRTNENFSIRKKFSQLMHGFGNYMVKCGTGKSQKLKLNNKNLPTSLKPKSKLPKKDKSWLLLSSEVSLNNIDNDDVFLS
jgi:GTPase SAR1 family protein